MTGELATAAAAAAVCGVAGLSVRPLIRLLPEPEPEPDADSDTDGDTDGDTDRDPKVPYADVAAAPGLTRAAVVAAGLAGAVVGWSVGWAWPLLFLLPLVPLGVALALVDWRTHYLPTRLVLPTLAVTAVLVAVTWAVTRDTDDLVRALVGLVAVRSFFWLLWFVHASGMGFGDVRLSAVVGLALGYLGWGELLVGTYAGFLIFAVPGLLVALVRWDRSFLRTPFPYGPFLLVGALVGIAVGDEVWAYLVDDGR